MVVDQWFGFCSKPGLCDAGYVSQIWFATCCVQGSLSTKGLVRHDVIYSQGRLVRESDLCWWSIHKPFVNRIV